MTLNRREGSSKLSQERAGSSSPSFLSTTLYNEGDFSLRIGNYLTFGFSSGKISTGSHSKRKMIRPSYQDEDKRFTLYRGDCLKILSLLKENSVDMIFADPPYNLSNGGISVRAGRMVSVNKGDWDNLG